MKPSKKKLVSEMTDQELAQRCEEFGMGKMSKEQLDAQRSIWEGDEYERYLEQNNPKVRMAENERCQEVLARNITASQKISEMVAIFLEEYPTYILPKDKTFHHPSALALYRDIDDWLMEQCGGVVAFWKLLLTAAKEWFPDKRSTKLGKCFCFRFECLDCTFWHGGGEMAEICKEYGEWIYGDLSQTSSSTNSLAQPNDNIEPDNRASQKAAAIAYAQIWNSGNYSAFIDLLDANCRYASQWVFQEMSSKEEIESYLTGKVDAVKKNGPKVKAELGEIRAPDPDDWCVLMYQGDTDEVTALVTFKTSNGKIARFDMCMPGLFSFKKTGKFPTVA